VRGTRLCFVVLSTRQGPVPPPFTFPLAIHYDGTCHWIALRPTPGAGPDSNGRTFLRRTDALFLALLPLPSSVQPARAEASDHEALFSFLCLDEAQCTLRTWSPIWI